MTLIQAIISGIVQGVTEFFPISSSGHLVLLHSWFGIHEPQISFDVFLHFGTLISVLVFFRDDIKKLFSVDRQLLMYISVASIPTFAVAVIFKDFAEEVFTKPGMVAVMMLVTGSVLLLTRVFNNNVEASRLKGDVGLLKSVIIGIAQGVCVIPGISRSGITISTGMLAGIDKEKAFRFSFLVSIPVILGANLLKIREISNNFLYEDTLYFMVGAITAMVTGFFAIKVLLNIIRNNLFYLFGAYCMGVGLYLLI